MTERTILIGAETVQSAANSIRSAASEMNRAAQTIETSVIEIRSFMEDWLCRFEQIVADHQKGGGA